MTAPEWHATESQRRAVEILTACLTDDYDMALSLMAEAPDPTNLMETTFQLAKVTIEAWAMANGSVPIEMWREFLIYLFGQEGGG